VARVWSKFHHIIWGLGIIYKVKISVLCGVISIYLCAYLAAAWYYCLQHKITKDKKIKEIREAFTENTVTQF